MHSINQHHYSAQSVIAVQRPAWKCSRSTGISVSTRGKPVIEGTVYMLPGVMEINREGKCCRGKDG